MTIADRVQSLRKGRGISQEELADKIGVSRQAVSKWESEQSVPDLDNVIIMSEFFGVTTDYLLKGIESDEQAKGKPANANVFVIVATVLNFIGLIISSAVWYEQQTPMAPVIGLIFMAAGCMVFGVGMLAPTINAKASAKRNFWIFNIWLLSFIPLSFIYNTIFTGGTAPYPLLSGTWLAFPAFWLVYFAICLTVVFLQIKFGVKKH